MATEPSVFPSSSIPLSPVHLWFCFAAFPCCSAHSLVCCTLVLSEICGTLSSPRLLPRFPSLGLTLVMPLSAQASTLWTHPPASSFLRPFYVGMERQPGGLPLRQQAGDSPPTVHFRQVVVREYPSYYIVSLPFWIPITISAISMGTWRTLLNLANSSNSLPVAPPCPSWLATRVPPNGGLYPTDAPMFVREITLVQVIHFPSSM